MSITISALPPATTLDGTELVAVVQDGFTRRTTTADIAALGGGGGSVAKVVQRFALIPTVESIDPNPTLELINSADTVNDGDAIYVVFYGSAEEATAPGASVQLDLKVNGSAVVQSFFDVGGQNSAFMGSLQIVRNGANLDCTGSIVIGRNTAGPGSPSVGTHINEGLASVAYGANVNVSLDVTWSAFTDPFAGVDAGFAQIMRAS